MKKLYFPIVGLLILFYLSDVYSQNVKEIRPQNSIWWTGRVGDGGTIYDDALEIGQSWWYTYRSWIKFDISNIPTTAIITKVDLHLNVTSAGGSDHKCHITNLGDVDPEIAPINELYNQIYWGTELLSNPWYTTDLRTLGHKLITLNSTANNILQTRLSEGKTWWAIGLYEEGDDDWKAVCDGYSQDNTNEPYAIISFNNDFAEPNENCAQAYSLTLPYLNNNLYLYPGETDYYKFTYNGNTFYVKVVGYSSTSEGYYGLSVSADGNNIVIETKDVGKNPKPDTKLYLYLGDCATEIAFDDDSGQGFFSLINYSSPCVSIQTISGCGSAYAQTFSGGGTGLWTENKPCGYSTPGSEMIYRFVAPATGTYSIEVTSASGYVDYSWKSGNPCDSTDWTCIDDINSIGTYGNMQWTAGQTYYILLDDENTSLGTHQFYINCPSQCTSPTATVQDASGIGSVVLTCNASGGSGGTIAYKWYAGNSCSGTVIGTSQSITVTSSGYYSCKAYISGYENTCYTCATGYANILQDPCSNVINILGCGPNYEMTFVTSNNQGAWNEQFCGWNVNGIEQVYKFTPQVTGTYKINVTENSASYVDIGYKTGSCSQSGWTCIADVWQTGEYGELNLTAGTTYYFLFDDEYPSSGILKFYLTCPNQLPSIAITYPQNNATINQPDITVTGTASDADGTISLVQVKLNNGNWENANGTTNWSKAITLIPGANIISARAQDNDGAWSQEVSITITYTTPNQAPTITITSPQNGSTVNTPNITVSGIANDPDGTVSLVQVKVNNGAWENATGTTNWSKNVALVSGTNVIYAKAQDNNGDWSQEASITVIYESPNQIPVVNITYPVNGATLNTQNITVQGTASDMDGSIVLVQVKVNNGNWENAVGTNNWSKSVFLEPGTNVIYAKAQDNNGAWSQEVYINVTYMTTNQPPVINITYPTTGTQLTSSSVNVTGTASDPDGNVVLVQVKVNNGSWENANGTTSWSKNVSLVPGTNIIYARAQDNQGAYSQEAYVNVVYQTQNVPPTIVITYPTENAVLTTSNIIVQGQAVDNDGQVTLVQVKVNAGNWENATGTTSWSKAVTLSFGGNIIMAKAQDNSGDWSSTAQVYVTCTVGMLEKIEDYLNVYPQPANSMLIVEFNDVLLNKTYELNLINTLGQIIYKQSNVQKTNIINVSELPEGIYILSLLTNENVINLKVIISR